MSLETKHAAMAAAERGKRFPAWLARGLWALLWLVLGVCMALAFIGYRQPELLLDFVNLRFCS